MDYMRGGIPLSHLNMFHRKTLTCLNLVVQLHLLPPIRSNPCQNTLPPELTRDLALAMPSNELEPTTFQSCFWGYVSMPDQLVEWQFLKAAVAGEQVLHGRGFQNNM